MTNPILAIQQLLRASAASAGSPLTDIKAILRGDPRQIPQSNLPAITISPMQTVYTARGNILDQKNHTIEVRLVYNAKDFYEKDTKTGQNDTVFIVDDAKLKMEKTGTDQSTDVLSVAGVIESHPSLPYNGSDTASLAKVVSVSYEGLSQRRGFHTYEATMTIEVTAIGDRY